MIHQQDIRRPLRLPRTIPAERLRAALDFVRYAPTIRGAWRARGVRLVATDVDWSHGKGPEVRGTGEALLMIMAGRPDALADLDGQRAWLTPRRTRPVTGGRSLSVTIPGAAATTAGTALVTGIAV